jgi:vitamin B12 transporter
MKTLFLVLSLMVFFCHELWAQEENVNVLPEMIITASRVEESVNDVAMKVIVIDQDDIDLSTATRVDQLLVEQNIGHLHVYPGSMTQVTMRGFQSSGESAGFSNPILFLIDGRRAGTGNLAQIPVTIVERIEVIKGASSAVYGAEAMGGVINIITKSGQGDPSVSLLAEGGSASRFRLSGAVQGFANGLDFYASTGRKDQRADYRTGDGDVYENTQSRSRDNFINLGYTFGEHHIGATVLEVDNWDVGVAAGKDTLYYDMEDKATKDLHSFDVKYDGSNEEFGLEWMTRYYQAEDHHTFCDYFRSVPTKYNYFTDTKGVQAQISWDKGVSRLIVGFDWDLQESRNTREPADKPYVVNADYERTGMFISEKISLFDEQLLINLGVRYDRYSIETKATQGYSTLNADDDTISEWSPRIGLVYNASNQLRFKASVARGMVLPTAAELVGDYVNSGSYVYDGVQYSYSEHYLGNNGLDPEESWTYEIGTDYTAQNWYSNVNLFYTEYKDKVVSNNYYDFSLGGNVKSFKNIDGSTISGSEFEFGCDLAPFLNTTWSIEPFVSLTYLFEFENEDTHEDLLYVSATQARFGVKTKSSKGFTAQVLGIYHGPLDYSQYDMKTSMSVREEMGGFTIWNMMVMQKISINWREGMSLIVNAGIENLFDKNYDYVVDYPMAGREYKASVTLTF